MAYSIILTSSEITELNRLRRTEKDGKILRRYQCIWMANDKFPKKQIALTLGVNIDTVTDWIKIFNNGRMASLRTLHYAGRKPSRLDIIKDLLKQYVKDEPVSKLSEVQYYLQNKHSITVEHSRLSRYLKKTSLLL